MGWFQILALIVILLLVGYGIYWFLHRNQHKVCAACLRERHAQVNWTATELDSATIEREQDSESDIGSEPDLEPESKNNVEVETKPINHEDHEASASN